MVSRSMGDAVKVMSPKSEHGLPRGGSCGSSLGVAVGATVGIGTWMGVGLGALVRVGADVG